MEDPQNNQPEHEEEHISLLSKIGASVAGGVVVLGLAWVGVDAIMDRRTESREFNNLELVDINAPSGRSLGAVFCTAAKEDGRFGVELEKSIDKKIKVTLSDGSQARIDCGAYTLEDI